MRQAPFIDQHYVVHDVSSDHVRIFAAKTTGIRDFVALLPNIGIKRNIQVGRAFHDDNLDDTLGQLLNMANVHDAKSRLPASLGPRL